MTSSKEEPRPRRDLVEILVDPSGRFGLLTSGRRGPEIEPAKIECDKSTHK